LTRACANDWSARAVVALITFWHCILLKKVTNSSAWPSSSVGSDDLKLMIRLSIVLSSELRLLVLESLAVPLYLVMYCLVCLLNC
jgi:hypothetical protein